jgi:hypothetical protein
MTTPNDATRPLPEQPAEGAPGWTSAPASPPSAPLSTPPRPIGDTAPVAPDDGTASLQSAAAAPVRAVDGPEAPARARWSGRKTAVVVAAALGLGALGAVGATAAVAQSDAGRGDDGGFGRHGQFPGGGQGQFPGGGQRQAPGAGQGRAPGDGGPGAPGGSTGGSTSPGDAHGGTPTLTT